MASVPSLNVCSPASKEWIAGRVETLLSHYFRPTTAEEIEEAAMMDWIGALSGFSREQISAACEKYLRSEPKRRPTPADIRGIIHGNRNGATRQGADRSGLTMDEAQLLQDKILPTARRWVLEYPPGSSMHDHGAQTLAYWGETA